MKRKPLEIPDGYTLEELEEAAKEYIRRKRREYNKKHPDIIEQQLLRTYTNKLRKNGFFVMHAELPEPPWTEDQEKFILQAIRANMEGLRNV